MGNIVQVVQSFEILIKNESKGSTIVSLDYFINFKDRCFATRHVDDY